MSVAPLVECLVLLGFFLVFFVVVSTEVSAFLAAYAESGSFDFVGGDGADGFFAANAAFHAFIDASQTIHALSGLLCAIA